jgi:hypothetical protein
MNDNKIIIPGINLPHHILTPKLTPENAKSKEEIKSFDTFSDRSCDSNKLDDDLDNVFHPNGLNDLSKELEQPIYLNDKKIDNTNTDNIRCSNYKNYLSLHVNNIFDQDNSYALICYQNKIDDCAKTKVKNKNENKSKVPINETETKIIDNTRKININKIKNKKIKIKKNEPKSFWGCCYCCYCED